MRATVTERFMKKIDATGGPDACHVWTASKTPFGYGYFVPTTKTHIYAHRWMLGHVRGAALAPEEWALHKWDNPSCVNPRHLYVGDRAQNMRDCVERGRLKNPIADAERAATHCKRGHPFDAINTYRTRVGTRRCRACRRARERGELS